jgi:hypothetical protein
MRPSKAYGMAPDYLWVGVDPAPAFRRRRDLAQVLFSAPARPDHADQDGPDVLCELKAPIAKRLKITIKRKIPITAATGDDR